MLLKMNFDLIIKFIPYVFPGICCTLFLTAFIISDRTFPKLILKSFTISVVCSFLLVLCDAIDFYLEFEKQHALVRQIVGSLNYIYRVACVGYLVRIAQRKTKVHVRCIDILVVINAVFAILNIWTGWIFRMHEDHTFSFGPLLNLPYAVTGIFVLLFIHSTVKYFRTNMGESVAVIAICLICLIANMIEIFLPVKIVLAQAFSISSVLYYLCLTTELYKRDALTDVFNRRTFFLDAIRKKRKSFAIIMLDLNDLKKFNDIEGHKAGDLAIITSVVCMQKIFKRYGTVYRLGGDEFGILVKKYYIPKIETLLNNFDELMQTTKYRMAFGYDIYNPGDNFETVLESADSKMYEHKMVLKNGQVR